jgi:hypothetical protein
MLHRTKGYDEVFTISIRRQSRCRTRKLIPVDVEFLHRVSVFGTVFLVRPRFQTPSQRFENCIENLVLSLAKAIRRIPFSNPPIFCDGFWQGCKIFRSYFYAGSVVPALDNTEVNKRIALSPNFEFESFNATGALNVVVVVKPLFWTVLREISKINVQFLIAVWCTTTSHILHSSEHNFSHRFLFLARKDAQDSRSFALLAQHWFRPFQPCCTRAPLSMAYIRP